MQLYLKRTATFLRKLNVCSLTQVYVNDRIAQNKKQMCDLIHCNIIVYLQDMVYG